jgi:predicted AAA+ superfamily ATPase
MVAHVVNGYHSRREYHQIAPLARDVALPQPSVHRYLNLLEISYLLVRLPAYAVNRTKRLIKTPKLYWGDTGVALHLAESAEYGDQARAGLLLHTGSTLEWIAPGVLAAPWWRVF